MADPDLIDGGGVGQHIFPVTLEPSDTPSPDIFLRGRRSLAIAFNPSNKSRRWSYDSMELFFAPEKNLLKAGVGEGARPGCPLDSPLISADVAIRPWCDTRFMYTVAT